MAGRFSGPNFLWIVFGLAYFQGHDLGLGTLSIFKVKFRRPIFGVRIFRVGQFLGSNSGADRFSRLNSGVARFSRSRFLALGLSGTPFRAERFSKPSCLACRFSRSNFGADHFWSQFWGWAKKSLSQRQNFVALLTKGVNVQIISTHPVVFDLCTGSGGPIVRFRYTTGVKFKFDR